MPITASVGCRRPFNPTHSVPASIHCLSRLLRERSVRVLFQRVPGSVQLLAPLLRCSCAMVIVRMLKSLLTRLCADQRNCNFFRSQCIKVTLLLSHFRSHATSAAPNQQLLYEAGMCVWQLTFYEPAAEAMGSSGVVQGLVDMARQATKEKVSLDMPLARSLSGPSCICICMMRGRQVVCSGKRHSNIRCQAGTASCIASALCR